MDDATTRKCTKCGQEKSLEDFGKSKGGKYGRKAHCKACEAAYARERHESKKKKARKAAPRKPEISPLQEVVTKITDKIKAASQACVQYPSDHAEQGLSRAEQLANEHWNYVETLLKAHLEEIPDLDCIAFHYKSAMIHGYKHGQADRSLKEKQA